MPRYAAVDIGSNSVRMMAADVKPAGTRILAQERQVTRLGESVFRTGFISSEALDFLCATLQRIAVIYKALDVVAVRAVATSAVRDAGNQAEFHQRVSEVLGTPVEVISGQEEARLIHLGVQARWPRPKERTLVIDVGGGSAELIVSEGPHLLDATSRPLGAVRLTELFLANDPPRAEDLVRLDQYIEEKLATFAGRHGSGRFDRVIATSSTAAALVCAVNRIPRAQREEADRARATTAEIRGFYQLIVKDDVSERRRWIGIGPRRAEIIVAGTAVFLRALEAFNHHSLYYSVAGVRDGIVADLAERGVGLDLSTLSQEQRDVVEAMAVHYGVSIDHARKVASLSHKLFEGTQALHQLPPSAGKLLEAAAYLHDIGHFVSSTAHHKHSAYLVTNSDLPGFQDTERLTIAALCRFHRKSLPQSRHSHFQALDPESKRAVMLLAPLLRIADSLDRSHEQKVRDLSITRKDRSLILELAADADPDLEIWAVGEVAPAFQQVYNLEVMVQRAKL